MWYTTIACVLFPVYLLLDVNHFIRSFVTIAFARARKKIRLLDPSTIYGIVLPTDIDFLLTHMNNAKYLREMDFARLDHGTRSGFFQEAVKRGGMALLSSSFIRYRLPLPIFSRYKVVSHIVWWDEKNVYLIHKVITIKDGIIRAIVYARASCVRVSVFDIVKSLSFDATDERPDLETVPPDYRKWMETLELSSQLMKQQKLGAGGGGDNNLNNGHQGKCVPEGKMLIDTCYSGTNEHQD